MATVSNPRKSEHKRKTAAARLAAIVLRWRTVHLQYPQSPESELWMSRTKRGEPKPARH